MYRGAAREGIGPYAFVLDAFTRRNLGLMIGYSSGRACREAPRNAPQDFPWDSAGEPTVYHGIPLYFQSIPLT